MDTPRWYNLKREKKPSTKDVGIIPKLSLKERDRRWNELRKKMALNGIDVLVFYGSDTGWGRGMVNFRYITHFADAHGGWAIFPSCGECTIFSGPAHVAIPYSRYISLQNWVTDLRPNSGTQVVARELIDRGFSKSRIGIVSYGSTGVSSDSMPYKGYMQLRNCLPEAEFIDANPILTEMRVIKSKEEIDFLYKAGTIARKKIDAMINSMKIGNTEADVFADMISADIKNGAEPQTFLLMSTGNVYDKDPGYKFLIHGSSQPASPVMRNLKDGDLAICEFHTTYGGYMAGAEFSLFLGKPPQELIDLHKACIESIQSAVDTIKPGITMREAWQAIRRPIEDRGFDYVELGFHGHGLASPEYPLSVYREIDGGTMAGYKIADFNFEENMVISLNIDVHNPDWRKDIGLMFGDMLHITKNGAIKMVNIPTEFVRNPV
jgi:Xaa-Pro aminopeptidase